LRQTSSRVWADAAHQPTTTGDRFGCHTTATTPGSPEHFSTTCATIVPRPVRRLARQMCVHLGHWLCALMVLLTGRACSPWPTELNEKLPLTRCLARPVTCQLGAHNCRDREILGVPAQDARHALPAELPSPRECRSASPCYRVGLSNCCACPSLTERSPPCHPTAWSAKCPRMSPSLLNSTPISARRSPRGAFRMPARLSGQRCASWLTTRCASSHVEHGVLD
jgi:hypothetical protein